MGHLSGDAGKNNYSLNKIIISPLSSGDALANYSIAEYSDYDDVRITHIDINNDGHIDFSFNRSGAIPYYDEQGEINHTPSFLNKRRFGMLLEQIRSVRKGEPLAALP